MTCYGTYVRRKGPDNWCNTCRWLVLRGCVPFGAGLHGNRRGMFHRFSVSRQLMRTVTGDGPASRRGWLIRNRWPSAVTTY
jgi:hypothetical protein